VQETETGVKLLKMAIPLIVASLSIASVVAPAFGSSQGADIASLVTSIFASQASIIIFIVELVLGFGLGFFSTKVFKHILALIAIFFVGVILHVWQTPQLGTDFTAQLAKVGVTWGQLVPLITSIIVVLGLTTVLPITLGFILGVVAAFAR
jgi:hypothetical protein